MAEAVARGSIVLSVDSTAVNTGMRQAAARAKQGGSEVAKNFKQSSNEQLGAAFGGTSVIASLGKAGFIGAAVAGVAALAKGLWDTYGPIRQLNKQIEYGAKLHADWRDRIAQSVAQNKEWISSLSDIAGTAAGLRFIGGEAGLITGSVEQVTAEVARLKAELEDMQSWTSWNSWAHFFTGTGDAAREGIKARLDATKSAAEALRKEADATTRSIWLLNHAEQNPAAVAAVRQMVQGFRDQTAALAGQSQEMIRLDALRRQFKLTQRQQDEVRNAWAISVAFQAAKERADEMAKAEADAATWIRELANETAALRGEVVQTADEAKLNEFILRGIDEAQIARIRELIQAKQRLNQQYKPLTALERGTASEISFQNRTRFEYDRDKADREKQTKLLQDQLQWLIQIALGVKGIDLTRPEF
jgi:hypothetical protein